MEIGTISSNHFGFRDSLTTKEQMYQWIFLPVIWQEKNKQKPKSYFPDSEILFYIQQKNVIIVVIVVLALFDKNALMRLVKEKSFEHYPISTSLALTCAEIFNFFSFLL